MNQVSHSLTKFRPVLTLELIQHISLLCKADECNPLSQAALKVFIPMIAKVEVGAINPAYKLSETHAIKKEKSALEQKYLRGLMSTEEAATYESEILGV